MAILPGKQGLLTVSADGNRRRVLECAAVRWAHVDSRARVIWFGRAGALWLLDLAAARTQPELVARAGL